MILITGASGKTGRAVIAALARRGQVVRALVRGQAQADAVRGAGAAESVLGDMRDPQALGQAALRARAIYHICPNMSPDEVPIGVNLIQAARAAGVAHVVYHSVLHPQTEKMPHHWNKLRVEESLFECGLAYSILQPAPYMQNLLAYWGGILSQGAFTLPYPAETRLSLVHLADVAEAAARVLTEPGHLGATYELAGTPGLSQTEVAQTLSQALGRPVEARSEPPATWEARARAGGLGEYAVQTLLKMFDYYGRYGLFSTPTVLSGLLGRAPTSLDEFARRAAA